MVVVLLRTSLMVRCRSCSPCLSFSRVLRSCSLRLYDVIAMAIRYMEVPTRASAVVGHPVSGTKRKPNSSTANRTPHVNARSERQVPFQPAVMVRLSDVPIHIEKVGHRGKCRTATHMPIKKLSSSM